MGVWEGCVWIDEGGVGEDAVVEVLIRWLGFFSLEGRRLRGDVVGV